LEIIYKLATKAGKSTFFRLELDEKSETEKKPEETTLIVPVVEANETFL